MQKNDYHIGVFHFKRLHFNAMIVAKSNKCLSSYFQASAKLYNLAFISPFCRALLDEKYCGSLLSSKVRSFCKYFHTTPLQGSSSPEAHVSSRALRIEAQEVLSDYLQSTRNFLFADAHHISKNCPHFIDQLLSLVEKGSDLKKSLRMFFSYNPINEFEPFFESLGLKPTKFLMFIPKDRIFLYDDELLMNNYRALCNFGVPRSNMGKMFLEAREIFYYSPGMLESKLLAYVKSGLGRSTVIKLIICSPSLLIGEADINCIKVVQKFKKLDFGDDWPLRYLFVKETYDWKMIADAIDFLEMLGYSEGKLQEFLKTNTALVLKRSNAKYFVGIVDRLLRIGVEKDEICSLLNEKPGIFSSSKAKRFIRSIDVLLEIGFKNKDIASFLFTHIDRLCSCSLKKPLALQQEKKMNKRELLYIMQENPEKFLSLCSGVRAKPTKNSTFEEYNRDLGRKEFLLRLGYSENTEEMKKAARLLRGRGNQLQERFECLIEAGMDFSDASYIAKHAPQVLNQKKEVIAKKIEFLKNILGHPVQSLVAFPSFLGHSVAKINLRLRMFAWLREKGAVRENLALSHIVACPETRFVKLYVNKHPDGSAYWKSLCLPSDSNSVGSK